MANSDLLNVFEQNSFNNKFVNLHRSQKNDDISEKYHISGFKQSKHTQIIWHKDNLKVEREFP